MTVLLQARDLLVCRSGRTVLELDHLSVDRGEVLAVAGPNGAGKTSLFLTLALLLKTERGEIFFDGHPVRASSPLGYRRRIALVLQEPLLMDLTVRENVALGLKFRRLPSSGIEARLAPWLERLGLKHLADRHARELSGGEAQRVSLARAFVLDPELLLLDEPFTSLDSPTRARLLEDLKSVLAETGITTIFITHDLQEARSLSTRLAVILDGRLCQTGLPHELFDAPASPQVAAFLGVGSPGREPFNGIPRDRSRGSL